MQKLTYILFLSFSLFLAGCGSNNSDADVVSSETTSNAQNTNSNNISTDTNGTIVFASGTNSATLTKNSEGYSVDILVLGEGNVPLTSGVVKVAYPDKVTTGVDIGSFASTEVEVVDGHAKFNYVGPQNLQERVDAGDTSSVFGFYLSSAPTKIQNFTFTYDPAPNQIVLSDYFLKESIGSGALAIGLEDSTQISFYVENDKGDKVADDKLTSLSITLLNGQLADLKDTDGNVADTLSFSKKNNVTVTFQTNTKSGIVPIKVDATFVDANSKTQTISKTFNMVVLSGPPTAISISYATTEHDKENAKFIEHMIITVTDKYFNRVNTQPAVSSALIAGYVLDKTGTRLYHNTKDASTATLDPSVDTLKVNGGVDLSNVNPDTDIAMTFGNGYTYYASGKWDITSLNGTDTLNLGDDFIAGGSISKLGYAIGHNYRQDTCRDGREWLGYVDVASEGNKLDINGMAKVDIYYDYYLTGKDVTVSVNILGKDVKTDTTAKLGEAVKITLRGAGFDDRSASVAAGSTGLVVNIPIKITNTGEWLRNANFAYKITFSDNLAVTAGPTMVGDVGACSADGVAYVTVTVDETKGESGTISVSDVVVASEF